MTKLTFVYNADSGVVNLLKDWVHKIVFPKTYPCSLCALTFDNLGMHRPWQEFIGGLDYETEFLHRDEFLEKYDANDVSLPAAFKVENGEPNIWIKTDAIDACESLDELTSLIIQKLAQEIG